MIPITHARTYARTETGSETPRVGGMACVVSPNRLGKDPEDENRGALRVGVVERNDDTETEGIAGFQAAVTYEEHGDVRFYVWQLEMWVGPYWALSEEIVPME